MRHVYIRGIIALIWFAAAIVCGISGSLGMAVLYVIMCGIFLYSASALWKKEKEKRGDL